MKKIYETTIINTGGRAGEVHSPDKSFSYAVASPGVKKENTTNPEQLFAAAYSACFNGALELVMDQEKVEGKSDEIDKLEKVLGKQGTAPQPDTIRGLLAYEPDVLESFTGVALTLILSALEQSTQATINALKMVD